MILASPMWGQAVDRYLLARDLSPLYESHFRLYCQRLERFGGMPLETSAIQEQMLNEWLTELAKSGDHSPGSVNGHRAAVLAVLKEEAQRGSVDPINSSFIKKMKVAKEPVTAWTHCEIRRLIASASIVPGFMRDQSCRRSDWWTAFFRFDYDTGLRREDALTVPWSMYDEAGGTVKTSQNKTGQPIVHWLSKATIAAVEKLDRETPFVLHWPYHHTKFDYWIRKIVRHAKIRKGTSRWLRRSGASYLDRDSPGHAEQWLGHLTPGLARRHYIDQTISQTKPKRPPEL